MSEFLFHKAKRLVFLFFGILVVSFWIIHLAPGSPADLSFGQTASFNSETRQRLIRLYALDRPVGERFVRWMAGVSRLDFGQSLADGRKASTKLLEALPVTVVMNAAALLNGLIFGVPLGVWMALYHKKKRSKVVDALCLGALSLPAFWMCLIGMEWLAVRVKIFPVSGLRSLFFEDLSGIGKLADMANHLALPVLVMSLVMAAAMARYVRASMSEELGKDYIRAARSRGISEIRVWFRHALKNALLPLVTVIGLSIPGLLGGSVVLETLFSIPGMGRLFSQAVFQRDYPVILCVLTLGAFVTLLANLLTDLAYYRLDPRIQRPGR